MESIPEISRGTSHPIRVIALAALLATGVWAPPADAYTRTCRAAYVIGETDAGGPYINRSFAARGTNAMHPNRAREDARETIRHCVSSHWAARYEDEAPAACRPTGFYPVVNYPFANLQRELNQLVCAELAAGRESVTVDVTVSVDGDTGCIPPPNQWQIPVARGYTFDCTVNRQGTIQPGFESLPRLERLDD